MVAEGEAALLGTAWLGHVAAARDRHEQNMEAALAPGGAGVVFRSIRRIEEGEELLVWYADELARLHGIPILTPSNIRGQ